MHVDVSGVGDDLEFVGPEFCSSGACLEAARMPDGRIVLRSSLTPEAPWCVVTSDEWSAFLGAAKSSRFDAL